MDLRIHFDYDDFFGVPEIEVCIDNSVLYDGVVQEFIELTCSVEDGPRQLIIRHKNKNNTQVNLHNDCHVFIKKIWFDSIDLDQIDYCQLTHRGKFYPEYDADYVATCQEQGIELPEYITPNHYLGHNGAWVLDFEAPVLLWVIRQQNPGGMHLEDTIFSTSHETLESVKKFFDLDV